MNESIEQGSMSADEARTLLAQVRVENEADLAAARQTLAGMAEDGTAAGANMTDVSAAAQHMVADAERILEEIAKAQARLDGGTYGRCTSCGGPIGEGRLRLRPYVATCIACAS